jgi:hypothetical protein
LVAAHERLWHVQHPPANPDSRVSMPGGTYAVLHKAVEGGDRDGEPGFAHRSARGGSPWRMPTLVYAPYAGHTAMIADYHDDGEKLVQTLLATGLNHVALTDWKSATEDMKDLDIDNYLADVVVAIGHLGGEVIHVGFVRRSRSVAHAGVGTANVWSHQTSPGGLRRR